MGSVWANGYVVQATQLLLLLLPPQWILNVELCFVVTHVYTNYASIAKCLVYCAVRCSAVQRCWMVNNVRREFSLEQKYHFENNFVESNGDRRIMAHKYGLLMHIYILHTYIVFQFDCSTPLSYHKTNRREHEHSQVRCIFEWSLMQIWNMHSANGLTLCGVHVIEFWSYKWNDDGAVFEYN